LPSLRQPEGRSEVLGYLDTAVSGLADHAQTGPSPGSGGAQRGAHPWVSAVAVLVRQLRSALLRLLAAAAIVSYFVGEHTDTVVIAVVLTVSVGLGFANECRAGRAGSALHGNVRHQAAAVRGGIARQRRCGGPGPGDVVRLDLGMVLLADIRLQAVEHLGCDESVLTGESARP
jgi:Mg2+-importing ATPase